MWRSLGGHTRMDDCFISVRVEGRGAPPSPESGRVLLSPRGCVPPSRTLKLAKHGLDVLESLYVDVVCAALALTRRTWKIAHSKCCCCCCRWHVPPLRRLHCCILYPGALDVVYYIDRVRSSSRRPRSKPQAREAESTCGIADHLYAHVPVGPASESNHPCLLRDDDAHRRRCRAKKRSERGASCRRVARISAPPYGEEERVSAGAVDVASSIDSAALGCRQE
ncbi:hypothetical protein C8Q77DRAFT_786679 [Trametes polyzona]|nr:hypothetical protein C8Q77DRAFT_786679 [Trametes polyzona]